ncbi:MAG: tRNA (N(6)-L-threonylcarbamoyladenosine(37)-C(2))-methylthiotransferase MtaB [Leptospirales bacterium]|jgi:threonylcarbamoyladenosine tRNA methylthiotransferase MtaB
MPASETAIAKKLKVSIQTLGCRLNQYESDGIMNKFAASGRYEPLLQTGGSASEPAADIAIINTCTVTDQADSRNRNAIKAALKKNPDCRVIVTGCFAQTDPEKLREIPGVKLVIGNDRKPALFELIDEVVRAESRETGAARAGHGAPERSEHEARYHPEPERFRDHAINGRYGLRPVLENPFGYGDVVPFGHTRAYMKIQDGCDRRCTYCKIPMARGRGISRSLADILEHVRRLDEAGVPEIVLTGVNLGWYRDANAPDASDRPLRFSGLIEKILETLRYGRLRLSSIEPCDVDQTLGELSLHPRFCDFLHVPLQSGSARILKAMRRTYSPYSFLKRMEKVRSVNPDLFCGTDMIVGFPGESEEDFADSLRLCADTGMANIHGFRYSPRAGTPAASFDAQVSHGVVRERMNRLMLAKEAGYRAYAKAFVGREREGVIEKLSEGADPGADREGRQGEALTDNYLRIGFALPEHSQAFVGVQKGHLVRLRLTTQDDVSGALSGEVLPGPGGGSGGIPEGPGRPKTRR